MKFADLKAGWSALGLKAKLTVIGTFAIIGCSLFFSLNNYSSIHDIESKANSGIPITAEGGIEIPRNATPIPIASDETRLVTNLVDILTNKECLWVSTEDDLCWVEFTEEGFTEYDGDLTKTASVEFYAIEAIENGRKGIWRVTYEDGSVHDASFLFMQDQEAGVYTMSSDAFPTYKSYKTVAITSENILDW